MSSWTPFSLEIFVFRATAAGPPEPLRPNWPTGTSQKWTHTEGFRPLQPCFPTHTCCFQAMASFSPTGPGPIYRGQPHTHTRPPGKLNTRLLQITGLGNKLHGTKPHWNKLQYHKFLGDLLFFGYCTENCTVLHDNRAVSPWTTMRVRLGPFAARANSLTT